MKHAALCLVLAAALGADPRSDQVDRIFANWDQPGSPGCAVGIIENGKFSYERGYGFANLEHDIRIDGKTAFYLGSTSKQFTAMAAILLAQRGVISVEHPVRRYIRELPEYAANVRIRHLLEHTSGIRDYVTLLNLAGAPDDASLTEPEALQLITRQKELNFPPGEEFLYSNSGYFLLGLILKRAAFRRLSDLAKDLIFTPLSMNGTLFLEDRFGLVKNRATGYSKRPDGSYRIDAATYDVVGDGGVFATLDDLLLWDRNFYDPKLGGAAAVREMMTPATLNGGRKLRYGRGLMLREYRGQEMISHAGGLHGYRSEILRFPKLRTSVFCLCNVNNAEASRLARQVADIYVPNGSTPIDATITIGAERKQGTFRDRSTGTILRLFAEDHRLMADLSGVRFELAPVTPTLFRSRNAPIDFEIEFDGQDRPVFTRLESESEKPANFEPVELVEKAATPEDYPGEYYSEEAEAAFRVTLDQGRLELRQKGNSIGVLEPSLKDCFRMSFLNIEFVRSDGKVTGFLLNTGRVRKLQFQRRS